MSIVVTPSHCVTDIRGRSLEALPDEVPFLVIIDVVVPVVAEDDGDDDDVDGDGVSEGDNRDDDDDDGDEEAGNKCVRNRCFSPSK